MMTNVNLGLKLDVCEGVIGLRPCEGVIGLRPCEGCCASCDQACGFFEEVNSESLLTRSAASITFSVGEHKATGRDHPCIHKLTPDSNDA